MAKPNHVLFCSRCKRGGQLLRPVMLTVNRRTQDVKFVYFCESCEAKEAKEEARRTR